ncbi:sensor histidine kinase [Novosphingobium piscinae]|uniref:histidine kinase n=1 Tax=Novosphingobium piscinae TaxID=1507448 RepID=A0A7X1FZ23_9SPHN|nr:HAMP domain-containing sensor histidine kinase [Novosphingobium piscinae]MBC2669634.1 HAMP domain-containing histidine kinase [Novosphingobium piscinae]
MTTPPLAPPSVPQVHGAIARTDSEDRLVAADEPLLGLQLRCGGDVPGAIAIPALREAVGKARALGLRIARPIIAQDGAESVTAWVEIEPAVDGCQIELRHWRSRPLPVEDEAAIARRKLAVERQIAELHARLDARQNVLYAAAESTELAALAARMDSARGRPWTDFVSIPGSAHQQPLHWRLLDGAPVAVEGSARPWRATLVPVGLPGSEPAGFELYLGSDLPAASQSEANPVAAQIRARMIGREVAPVLRQPIARIIANAETIRSRLAGPLSEEYSAYAADIATAGQHLLALIDDLTDLEVVEADDFSTAPDRIDLAEVARQAAGILGVKARERGIVIDAPRPGESLPAVAEFRRVLQVLLNLVGNALRYAPEGSQIWIRLEDEAGLARVIVADQGPGLDPAQQRKVFEKFERLGRSGDGGSGLGLYISRRLARAMGGDLTVDSAPGQGARFVLTVPGDLPVSR